MTVNIGIPAGKVWRVAAKIVLAISAAFLIGLGVFIMPLDFGETNVAISNDIISITVPYLSYEVKTENIVSIKLIDDLPHSTKKHGRNSERACQGDFYVNGYGLSKVYVNPKLLLF